jgi:hypothetical protein
VSPIERMKYVSRIRHSVPGNVVIASTEPLKMGEVLLLAGYRFAVEERLTRPEFERRLAKNERERYRQEVEAGIDPNDAVLGSFTATIEGSKALERGAEFSTQPEPDQQYYYAMRRT